MSNYVFPWVADYLARQDAQRPKPQAAVTDPARNGCTCECHNHPVGTIMHFIDCCPSTPSSEEKNHDPH